MPRRAVDIARQRAIGTRRMQAAMPLVANPPQMNLSWASKNPRKAAALGQNAKKQAARVVGGVRRHPGRVAIGLAAIGIAGSVTRSTGRAADRPVGRPTGMYGY